MLGKLYVNNCGSIEFQECICSNHFPWRWASQKNKTPDRTILKKSWAAKVRSSHGYRTRSRYQPIWFKHVDVRMCGAPWEMWQTCSKNSSPRKTLQTIEMICDKDVYWVCGFFRVFWKWRLRRKVGNLGVDFQDGMRTLLDLRFADDMFSRLYKH